MKRSEQNLALKNLQDLVAAIGDFEQDVRHVLLRNTFDEARVLPAWDANDPMKGTPPPAQGDPTGEEAIATETMARDIAKTINKMSASLIQWHEMAKWIKGLAGTDVVARAQRTVPDCLACGDPCIDQVRSGFDNKCYMRFIRAGRPDRNKFIAGIKSEQMSEIDEVDASE